MNNLKRLWLALLINGFNKNERGDEISAIEIIEFDRDFCFTFDKKTVTYCLYERNGLTLSYIRFDRDDSLILLKMSGDSNKIL